jgi:PAS domain S-box-containing protein
MIYQVTKDKDGFIWIATSDGLIRFDGINQRIYKNNPAHENTISGNRIRSLFYDKDDQLWIGTVGNGLNIYNNETDRFTSFISDQNNPKTLSNNDVLCVFQDSKDRIWVGTEKGLNLFNPVDSSFQQFLPDTNNPRSIGSNAVLKIFEDSHGRIWIGTWNGGLNLLIPSPEGEFSFLALKKDDSNPYSITSNHIWDFVEDDNHRIWLATFDGGLVTFDMPEGPLQSLTVEDFKFKSFTKSLGKLENHRFFSITKDKAGDIWLGSSVGLGIFNPNEVDCTINAKPSEIFHTYLHTENGDNKTLPHNEVRNLYFDEQKEIVWVSTFGGIGYHYMAEKKFEHYNLPFASEGVTLLLQAKNPNIQYFGLFAEGFVEHNKQTKSYQHYRHPSNDSNFDRILSMKEFGDSIWIGTQAGLSIFDKRTKKLSTVVGLLADEKISIYSIIKIFQDSEKRIWLTTDKGLFQTDNSLSKVIAYKSDDNNPNTISDNMVTDIEEDKQGNLWVVTCGGGLNKLTFDEKGKPIIKFFGVDHRTGNAATTDLLIFAEIDEKNEVIWLGTETGVIKYLIKEDKFINDLSFSRSRIFGFSLINNNIWLTDSDGITRYDIDADRASKYLIADGLQPGGYFYYSYLYNENNKHLFFGGAEGYQYFNPDNIAQNDHVNPLLITDLKIFNQSIEVNKSDEITNKVILTKNMTRTESIDLSYLHTSISLSITPMDFENAKRYLYAYKLEGLEDEWKYSSETEINYSRLPHGDYTFVAKAKNSDGHWSPPTKLKIKIIPPFWKRLDFIIIMSLLFSLTCLWLIHTKIERVNSEKENLENLVLNASTALPDVMQQHLSVEDILRENKVFFEKLYSESPLGIAFTDSSFNIIKCNDQFISIFENEEVNDSQFFDFMRIEKTTNYPSKVASLTKKQEKTFRDDIPYEVNNQKIWLNTAFSFLYDENNKLRYSIIKVSDVTDRKEKEKLIDSLVKEIKGKNEELEQKVFIRTKDLAHTNKKLIVKNEELARFAHIASHDLKEPLRNISSFVGLINLKSKKEELSKEILEYLHFIKLNTHQMHTIITDVLEYSKFDKNEFSIESVDVPQIVEEVKISLSNFIAENNAQIKTYNLPIFTSNRGFLFLLLKNLINNGIKYNESSVPTIEISCIEEKTQYIFKIKDNGIGIDSAYHDQIFTMFKRLHTRERYKGSGLGLALCKRIVERMNGRVTVESEVGIGSTFTIVHPKFLTSDFPSPATVMQEICEI